METVYIETSCVSLLVAGRSRDLIIAGNQQVTRDWWAHRSREFLCVASAEVVREASQGEAEEVRKRLEALEGIPLLGVTDQAIDLAKRLLASGILPARAQADAAHLAIAATAKVDYLLTWNCRHLANAQILRRLKMEAQRHGWELPTVCTPAELMGDYERESGRFT